jgi:hypothetical protein
MAFHLYPLQMSDVEDALQDLQLYGRQVRLALKIPASDLISKFGMTVADLRRFVESALVFLWDHEHFQDFDFLRDLLFLAHRHYPCLSGSGKVLYGLLCQRIDLLELFRDSMALDNSSYHLIKEALYKLANLNIISGDLADSLMETIPMPRRDRQQSDYRALPKDEEQIQAILRRHQAMLRCEEDELIDNDNVAEEGNGGGAGGSFTIQEEALYAAFLKEPGVFDKSQRKGARRADFLRQTGMTHEQLEGWAVMLQRHPHRQLLLAKFEEHECRQSIRTRQPRMVEEND